MNKNFILSGIALYSILLLPVICTGMKNIERPVPETPADGTFITVHDGTKIFVHEKKPPVASASTIYIIPGITGINHRNEKDLIDILSNNINRVIVIHPRGTGYSEGKRGDISGFDEIISDYTEIISKDRSDSDSLKKVILYGHSMSCAIAMNVAHELKNTDGIILVNPPVKMKSAKGMSPGLKDYAKYAFYYVFAPHVPIVNMAGDPSAIENAADREESQIKSNDPLLVKYFSMRCMTATRKLMNSMVRNASKADYPMLLLYGDNDMIVDRKGCDELFNAWKNPDKNYEIVPGGTHGKSTVLKGDGIIRQWLATKTEMQE